MRRALALAAVAALGAACSSDPRSGYAWGASRDESLGPIATPVWENETYSHGVEARLTEALAKEIQRTTPWKVASQESARTVIVGTIRSVELRKLSAADVSGLVEDVGVEITADFEWKERSSGRVIVARRGLRSIGTFVPALGVGERLEVGQNEAVGRLARDVVASMRAPW
jgi:hypothetical protein